MEGKSDLRDVHLPFQIATNIWEYIQSSSDLLLKNFLVNLQSHIFCVQRHPGALDSGVEAASHPGNKPVIRTTAASFYSGVEWNKLSLSERCQLGVTPDAKDNGGKG